MTPTEKLVKKEFKIKTEAALIELISSKYDAFYQNNFFSRKAQYVENIQQLIASINSLGEVYGMAMAEMRSGSMITSFAGQVLSEVKGEYLQKRKALENHVRLFQ